MKDTASDFAAGHSDFVKSSCKLFGTAVSVLQIWASAVYSAGRSQNIHVESSFIWSKLNLSLFAVGFFSMALVVSHNNTPDHISPSSWQSYQHHAGDLCCLLLPVVSTNNVLPLEQCPLLLYSQVPFFIASEQLGAFWMCHRDLDTFFDSSWNSEFWRPSVCWRDFPIAK